WLMAIATTHYLVGRRGRRRAPVWLAAAVDDVVATAAEPAEWQDLLTAMHRLPREVVLPIVLKHYYGYAYGDIAAVMGVPVGTVKSRIHNGMATIRKELTGDAG
ncbi:MAG: sigma factor-like helix-turn-helix DNA-binding protein, partial [Chloroflexota bacterium]